MSSLEDLRQLVLAFRDEHDWEQFHNPKDLAISLSLEAAEFLEQFQWKNPDEISQHLKQHAEAVQDELADVLYWVLLISGDMNVDLDKALRSKLVKNAQKYPIAKSKGRHNKYTEL